MYLANRCYTLTYIDVIYLIFALRDKIYDNTFQIYRQYIPNILFFIDISPKIFIILLIIV